MAPKSLSAFVAAMLTISLAAPLSAQKKIERRLPWHLHSILHVPAGSGERILDHRRRALRVCLGIIRRELRSGNSLPGPGHLCAELRQRNICVAAGAYVAPQITAFAGARERGDHQHQRDRVYG